MPKDVTFPEIKSDVGNPSTYHQNPNTTDMTQPRKMKTGNSGGEWTIKGKIQIIDENNVVRLLLGFQKDGF